MGKTVYTFQLLTFHPNKTVNKKKSKRCKKQGIKNLFLYIIQGKYHNTANKNLNAVDDNERTFNHIWPKNGGGIIHSRLILVPQKLVEGTLELRLDVVSETIIIINILNEG